MLESREMRAVYCEALIRLAERDERFIALDADLSGACGTRPFAERFPERSFNVGIAEANMIGVAAGLAAAGKIPVVHSFGTFSTRRCFDQVAISVGYSKLPVKIIGTDPGVSAEVNGGTHMPLEDVGIMRTLPNMLLFEPVDTVQLEQALPWFMNHESPGYMRLLRKKAESVFGPDYVFRPGKADILREGSDVTIPVTGLMTAIALEAAASLAAEGIEAEVVNVHTLFPLDSETLLASASKTGAVVTVENHSVIGGLGSAVTELLAENMPLPLWRVGVRDRYGEVGNREGLLQTFGLTAPDISNAVRKTLQRKAARAS